MKSRFYMSIWVSFFAFFTTGLADTVMVSGGGTALQEAINSASGGDVLIVEPGTYSSINFNGKNITVVGSNPNDANTVAATIIDAGGLGSVVTFANGEGPDAVLSGFTITGGTGTFEGWDAYWGGGIYCLGSSPTITRNVIAGNNVPPEGGSGYGYGGGIFCGYSSAVIERNIIKQNTAYFGGGIMAVWGDWRISNNLIYADWAEVGGGVYLGYGGRLINNTLVGNSAPSGGNVCAESDINYGLCVIANNIIASSLSGHGVYWNSYEPYDTVTYNNVWNNAWGDYSQHAAPDPTGTNGNISQDPLFMEPGTHDYHLQMDSPCINAGDPDFAGGPAETDIDGEVRIFALRVDIGADEYVGYVKPVANAGPDQYLDEIQIVALDGSESFFHDSNGIKIFQWTQIAGPAVTLSDPCAAQSSFLPVLEAVYSFELVVGDGIEFSLPDTVLIVVGNCPPLADPGPNSVYQVGERVYLDGSSSYDPNPDDELTYSWHQVEGPNVVLYDANTATPYFNPSKDGRYTFELVVSDGVLTSLPDTVSVDALKSGLLLYFSFDGIFGSDLPDLITDDSGNDFEFTRYAAGTGTVTYGESSPVVATDTASADFFPNAGFYRVDPSPWEIEEPLRLAGYQYTVEFWMKPGPLNGSLGDHATLIGYRNIGTQDSSSWRFDLNYAGGRHELRYFHRGQDEGVFAPDVDEWHHVAGVFNRNAGEQHRMEFFLDGEVVEDASISSLNRRITEPIGIGCNALEDGTFVNFFDGLLDEIRVYNMALPVCQFQLTAAEEHACCPNPEDGERFVDPCGLFLSWRAGEGVQWHDVYFGTNSDEVADADTSSSAYMGRQGNFDTFYFPPEFLEHDQTYYWRIDEVNGPNTLKGRVWSFRTSLNLVVYHHYQEARYPAKNGLLWTWGDDEIVVGFEIAGQQSKVLSRSADGGMTWSMFDPPNYAGDGDLPVPSPGGINFGHPDFAMRVSGDVFWVSYDRCASWAGPYEMGDLGLPDSDNWEQTSVTDYVVKGPNDCLLFMSARSQVYGRDGTFCVRTTDGGATFEFQGWIVAPSDPHMSVMTSTVGSACSLSSAVQRVDPMTGEGYVDLLVSSDEGTSWELRSHVGETGKGGGDPPALVRLHDGRLCCVYGHRDDVRMYIRYSYDEGRTWDEQLVLRDDWGGYSNHELGYPRIGQLADGSVVCAYYWSTLSRMEHYIAATIWSELSCADLGGEVENLRTGERYALIQDAICRAADGDEIVVHPGTYYGIINFYGKDLKVRSANPMDPSVVAATVIHGWGHGPTVVFEWGEKSSSVLAGLTITDGNCGIDCNDSAPTIRNCVVTGNKSMGIRGRNTNVRITGCTVTHNGATGLDLWSEGGSPMASVSNCTIVANGAEGLRCEHSGAGLTNCLIAGNVSDGILANSYGGVVMTNCTVVDNGDEGVDAEESRLTICNCIIRDNWAGQILERYGLTRVSYSDIQGGWPGLGNMDADPCFVTLGSWKDINDANVHVEPNDPNAIWVNGNYRLQPDSPCIDTGDNTVLPPDDGDLDGDGNTAEPIPFDLDDNDRMVDGDDDGNTVVDMGTYEYFVPPIEVTMRITPQAFNPGSEGNWFKLHFVLPDGYDINDVDVNTPAKCTLMDTGQMIESDYVNAFVNEEGLVEVEAGFDRSAFALCLSQPADRTLTVMGLLAGTSGQDFYGTDTVRIINNTLQQIAAFASYWLTEGCDSPDWCDGVDLDQNGTVDFADFAMSEGCCIEVIVE